MTQLQPKRFIYPSVVGMICMLFGLALCRFSYTPMIPFLVNHNWLTAVEANYVGSFNFIGYFIGAVLAFSASRLLDRRLLIRFGLMTTVITLAACAIHLGYVWLAAWRLLAGILGAFIVILSPMVVLQHVANDRNKAAGGLIFTGVGVGIIASSLIVPWLANFSLMVMWLGFTLIALVLLIVAWPLFGWSLQLPSSGAVSVEGPTVAWRKVCVLLGVSYFVCGIGVVPHTLFISHYMHQDLGVSLTNSGLLFSIFGVGCLLGAFLGGVVSARIGVYLTLVWGYVIGILAIALLIFAQYESWVLLSLLLIGIYLFATVSLTSLRVSEVVLASEHPKYWGRITLCFALGQAAGSYGLSAALASGMSYHMSFCIAAIALVVGLAAVIVAK